MKGLLRTYTLALEERIGHRVPPEAPIIAWLVSFTAFLMTIRIKYHDGRTGFENVRGRPFTTKLPEFGESCRHKLPLRDAQDNGTLAARWGKGVFIGVDRLTLQYLVHDGENVVMARTVTRLPDCQKWCKDALAAVRCRPLQLHVPKEPVVIFREPVEGAEDPAQMAARAVRGLYVKKSDVEAFGYTSGCPKCDSDLRYGFGRTTRGHSVPCRRRIMGELAKTPAGQERLQAATGRLDWALTDLMEKNLNEQAHAQGENVDDGLRQVLVQHDYAPPRF